MTETIINASTATYYRVQGASANYATARNTCYGLSSSYKVGQDFVTPNYFCNRLTLAFDTSVIPDGDTITDVKLRMVCASDDSTTDFDIRIAEFDWSASDPLASGNQEAVFDGILAEADYFTWRSTSGMAVNTQYSGASMNAAYVKKTGITYYGLISAEDHNNSTPTDAELVTLADPAHATASYRPALIVTHAEAGWANIAKINGVASSGIAKVNGVIVASISKVNGVSV